MPSTIVGNFILLYANPRTLLNFRADGIGCASPIVQECGRCSRTASYEGPSVTMQATSDHAGVKHKSVDVADLESIREARESESFADK